MKIDWDRLAWVRVCAGLYEASNGWDIVRRQESGGGWRLYVGDSLTPYHARTMYYARTLADAKEKAEEIRLEKLQNKIASLPVRELSPEAIRLDELNTPHDERPDLQPGAIRTGEDARSFGVERGSKAEDHPE